MCSQCYAFVPRDFLKLTDYHDTVKNITSKIPSLVYYIQNGTGVLCRPRGPHQRPHCQIADPEFLNRNAQDPDNDEILKTFSSKFHRVSFDSRLLKIPILGDSSPAGQLPFTQ